MAFLKPVTFADVTIEPDTGELLVGGRVVAHVMKQRAVFLVALLERAPRVVSNEHLLTVLWGYRNDGPTMKAVHVHAHRVRRMFMTLGVPLAVNTIWGIGYRVDRLL